MIAKYKPSFPCLYVYAASLAEDKSHLDRDLGGQSRRVAAKGSQLEGLALGKPRTAVGPITSSIHLNKE